MNIFLATIFTGLVGFFLLTFYQLKGRSKWSIARFVCILGICFFISLDLLTLRTPSKDRLESVLGFSVGDKVEVLKDEYQDMLQDYTILYNIKLNKEDMGRLKNYIDSTEINPSTTETGSTLKSYWNKKDDVYYFNRTKKGLYQYIKIDIHSATIEYEEALL